MTTRIKDGTGHGYVAKVDKRNRLCTYTTTRNEIAYQSEFREKSFMAYGKRDFNAGSTDENIMHFTYTGDGSCHIDRIIISTNSILAKLELYVSSVYVSGGDLREPVNLNLSSNITSETTIYNGTSDLSMTTTDTNEIVDVRLSNTGQPTIQLVFEGGLILRYNNTLGVVGEVASASDVIRCSFYFYEEEDQ